MHCACHSISSEALKKMSINFLSIENRFSRNYLGFSFVAFYYLISVMFWVFFSDLSFAKVILGFQIKYLG